MRCISLFIGQNEVETGLYTAGLELYLHISIHPFCFNPPFLPLPSMIPNKQECKSPETARRVLEEKGVAHLWDMVIASAKAARASASGTPGAASAMGGY